MSLDDVKYEVLIGLLTEMLCKEAAFKGNANVSVEHMVATQTCIDRPTNIKTLLKHIKSYGRFLYQRGLYDKSEELLEEEIDKRINRTYNISRLI